MKNQPSINYLNKGSKGGLLLSRILVYILLIFISSIALFFFYLLIINSTRSNAQLQAGFSLLPRDNFINNLVNAWNDGSINIPRGLVNSFIVATFSAVLTTYFSAMTAYGIHVYMFKGRKIAFNFIMIIMTIPTQVSAVGFVQIVYNLDLTNSFIPLIIPAAASPVVFFYMKQYFESILPLEVVEAARVDGSNEFRTFNLISLPMIKPALAVQTIFSFVFSWNNFFIPALIIDDADKRTVPIMIAQLRSADYSKQDMGKVFMFILLSIVPVLLVYVFLSKFIIKGVTLGSVKG